MRRHQSPGRAPPWPSSQWLAATSSHLRSSRAPSDDSSSNTRLPEAQLLSRASCRLSSQPIDPRIRSAHRHGALDALAPARPDAKTSPQYHATDLAHSKLAGPFSNQRRSKTSNITRYRNSRAAFIEIHRRDVTAACVFACQKRSVCSQRRFRSDLQMWIVRDLFAIWNLKPTTRQFRTTSPALGDSQHVRIPTADIPSRASRTRLGKTSL